MSYLKIFGICLLIVSGVISVYVYLSYQHDIRAARERISSGSKIIDTACGPIEYADIGEGAPVLVIHGAGGGFDQGLMAAHDWIGDGYRFIAPSRFGYLRTPLPENATPIAQADAHACLLDALGIKRAAVVAASAGALSAVPLAIRHPGKVSAMVLLIPAAWAPPSPEAPAEEIMKKGFITDVVLKSDFVMWFFTKYTRKQMITFLGVPKNVQERLTPEQNKDISRLMKNILPVSPRVDGMVNDGINHAARQRYALENITAPTLIIDSADVGTYAGARYTAEHIPGAKFIGFESGGHLLVGQYGEVRKEVSQFLKENEMTEVQKGGSNVTGKI